MSKINQKIANLSKTYRKYVASNSVFNFSDKFLKIVFFKDEFLECIFLILLY